MKRRDTGILGEKLAKDFLEKQGYHILQTNYRCPEGEIDIIAIDPNPILPPTLVLCEVKTYKSKSMLTPEEVVNPSKIEKIWSAAYEFFEINPKYSTFETRIDLLVIGKGIVLKHIRNFN